MSTALFLALALQPPAQMVQSEAVLKSETFKPGVPVSVAFKLTLDEAWHVYWRNPGDSGVGTEVKWNLPAGWKAGPLRYPTPERINLGSGYGFSFGYENEVVFMATVTPPLSATKPVKIGVDMTLLACKTDCVPADQSFEISLAPGNGKPTAQSQFETWAKKIPAQVSIKTAKVTWGSDRSYRIQVPALPALKDAETLEFFPSIPGQTNTEKPVTVKKAVDGSWVLHVIAGQAITSAPKQVPFLVIPMDKDGQHLNQGVEFVVSP